MSTPELPFPGPDDRIAIEVSENQVRLIFENATAELTVDEALGLSARFAEAAVRASEGNEAADENSNRVIPMQYLYLSAEAIDEALENGEEGQMARVHCWIRGQTTQNAFFIAKGMIENDDQWLPLEVIDQREVRRDDFVGNDLLPYFDQALTDGEVIVFELDEA